MECRMPSHRETGILLVLECDSKTKAPKRQKAKGYTANGQHLNSRIIGGHCHWTLGAASLPIHDAANCVEMGSSPFMSSPARVWVHFLPPTIELGDGVSLQILVDCDDSLRRKGWNE